MDEYPEESNQFLPSAPSTTTHASTPLSTLGNSEDSNTFSAFFATQRQTYLKKIQSEKDPRALASGTLPRMLQPFKQVPVHPATQCPLQTVRNLQFVDPETVAAKKHRARNIGS